MLPIAEFVATLAATLFAGAALYITWAEHPARMACSTRIAATVWAPSYQRATLMQAPLAVISGFSAALTWWLSDGLTWLIASVLILTVVPFTLIVVMKTNQRLLEPGRDLDSAETRLLLVKWGRLHAVRTVLSVAASLMMLGQLVWG
jgi:hypothetical protein